MLPAPIATVADLAGLRRRDEKLRANGHRVERVFIDPATSRAWCRENGFELTSQARQRYAGVMVGHLAAARAH